MPAHGWIGKTSEEGHGLGERLPDIGRTESGQVWTLNAAQSLAFVLAVLDPPEPTAVQRAYAADYWAAIAEIAASERNASLTAQCDSSCQ